MLFAVEGLGFDRDLGAPALANLLGLRRSQEAHARHLDLQTLGGHHVLHFAHSVRIFGGRRRRFGVAFRLGIAIRLGISGRRRVGRCGRRLGGRRRLSQSCVWRLGLWRHLAATARDRSRHEPGSDEDLKTDAHGCAALHGGDDSLARDLEQRPFGGGGGACRRDQASRGARRR